MRPLPQLRLATRVAGKNGYLESMGRQSKRERSGVTLAAAYKGWKGRCKKKYMHVADYNRRRACEERNGCCAVSTPAYRVKTGKKLRSRLAIRTLTGTVAGLPAMVL